MALTPYIHGLKLLKNLTTPFQNLAVARQVAVLSNVFQRAYMLDFLHEPNKKV